jgi:hypothetical protein
MFQEVARSNQLSLGGKDKAKENSKDDRCGASRMIPRYMN